MGGNGGGIYNENELTVINTNLVNNYADNYGGGIDNFGTFTLTDSNLNNNIATTGGGICNEGCLYVCYMNITGSALSYNIASSYAGGIENYGSMTLIHCSILYLITPHFH